jgi:hypothetical protein
MDDTGLGGVVGSLHLWDVHDMSAHRSCGNKAAVAIVLQLLSVDIRTLLLLASPDVGSGSSTVEGSIKVGSDDVCVVLKFTLGHRSLGPWNARVSHEDIEAAVELLDNCGYSFFNCLWVLDVNLVCLA